MPSDTFETIQALIQDEIGERENAAKEWDEAATGLDEGTTQGTAYGEVCRARAQAAQNRAEMYRLNRRKLELEIEAREILH